MSKGLSRLKAVFKEYAHDIEVDEKNGVVYFTLNIDDGADEWMGTQSSAVCYNEVEGEKMVVEYDIRLSQVPVDVVESVVDDMSMRYKMHIDTVDSGHGSGSTAHIRNYSARIRLGKFEEFFDRFYKDIEEELG